MTYDPQKSASMQIGATAFPEWPIFDWYNGRLKSDTNLILHNVGAATSTAAQRDKLASLADNNKAAQLSLAAAFQHVLNDS